ncbi:MAG: hypothetical protein ACYDA0_00425 [Candidatus Dormibacteraceae bacterium]
MYRLCAPMSLVAALVLIAMVAAGLVGGRLVQDWNASHTQAPAGGTPQSVLGKLEARPLRSPVLRSIGPSSPARLLAGLAPPGGSSMPAD